MKKLVAIFLIAVMLVFAIAGCGNMSIGLGNLEFGRVHIDTHHYSGCLTIEKWHNNESGIEVLTREAGSIFLSEGTYILLEGDKQCPFCSGS